jgi:hypothetical protein
MIHLFHLHMKTSSVKQDLNFSSVKMFGLVQHLVVTKACHSYVLFYYFGGRPPYGYPRNVG